MASPCLQDIKMNSSKPLVIQTRYLGRKQNDGNPSSIRDDILQLANILGDESWLPQYNTLTRLNNAQIINRRMIKFND